MMDRADGRGICTKRRAFINSSGIIKELHIRIKKFNVQKSLTLLIAL